MAISNGYATLAEAKSFLGIADATDDALIEQAVESASRRIDALADRRFWQDAAVVQRFYTYTARTYYGAGDTVLFLPDDVSTATSFLLATDTAGDGTFATSWTIDTDFRLEPLNAVADGVPFTSIRAVGSKRFPTTERGIRVTARFGWAAVPLPVKEATLILAGRIFRRKDSLLGVQGFQDFGPAFISIKPDPDVTALVAPYRKLWAVA